MTTLFNYTLRLADNALILGHRLSEWCGHGPVLEQDIALINIALDHIGQARNLYQYAANIENKGRTEDDLCYLRTVTEYRNLLLLEQPNGNFGDTIARSLYFDAFNFFFYDALRQSKDETLAAIAEKSLKEVTYHLRWSSEWVIRLGDGTEESHDKMQDAINDLWSFSGEALIADDLDKAAVTEGFGVDLEAIKPKVLQKISEVLSEATLKVPNGTWFQTGGKQGKHSEHLGYILTELQYLQRAYPNQVW